MFEEIRNTLSDIRSGALPASELPGFLASLFRKVAWLAIVVIFAFAIGFVLGM
jgi:hypothetical protein